MAGDEGCLLRGVGAVPGHHFMSFDAGLRGYRTRPFLADLYRRQGREAEAEGQWRAALAERPGFTPARQALAALLLGQGRLAVLDEAVATLARAPRAPLHAARLQARVHPAPRVATPARPLLGRG